MSPSSNSIAVDDRLDRHRHRAQMNRHVVAHRNHSLPAVKERAGIVAPLLDIRRDRSPSQRRAHLLRNRMDAALKDRQLNRVLHLIAPSSMHLDHQIPQAIHPQNIAQRQYRGGAVLGDNRRPRKRISRPQQIAVVDARLLKTAVKVHRPRADQRLRSISLQQRLNNGSNASAALTIRTRTFTTSSARVSFANP